MGLAKVFKIIPDLFKMILGILKIIPMLIKLLMFIMVKLPQMIFKTLSKIGKFGSNAMKVPFAVIVSFFLVFLLLQTAITQLTGVPGLIPHIPLAAFALFIVYDLVVNKVAFLRSFQQSLLNGFLFIFNNPITKPLFKFNANPHSMTSVLMWCLKNSITIITTLFFLAFMAKYAFAYMQTVMGGILETLGIGGLIPEGPLTFVTMAVIYDLLVNNKFILEQIQKMIISFVTVSFNNPLSKFLLNYNLKITKKTPMSKKIQLVIGWFAKNFLRIFAYSICLILLLKYGFAYTQSSIGSILEYFELDGILPEGPLSIVTTILLYQIFVNNPFIAKFALKIFTQFIFVLLQNPLVREILNFKLNVDPSNVSQHSVAIFKWASANSVRILVFSLFIIFIIKVFIKKSISYIMPFAE